MAKIALRVYNNEISDLVDHGQLDEAIAHCRHILEQFPRYIETYRLFGKSYLEGNQYGDAADILQRVISSVPDDFVSQIGMSIIREDEGDLDAAIYHMERTFEAQPSNQAIQEELRRLYGRRDGVEPAKIRLTRGALARMYAHGNLFEQAVAELSAALSDDPSRLDLSVLLAEMYFKMDKHVEAADLCINILEKLPNNLSANRILFFILSQSNRLEESDIYKQIWISLDPYVEFLEDGSSDLSQVADNAVTIEKLPWDPELYAEQQKDQPDWVSSLGVSVEKDEDSADKNWIFSPEQAEKSIEDTAPVKVNDLGDDPLFTESDETDDEVLAWIGSDSEDSIEDQSTDDADGEIPDWILEGVVESEEGEGDSVGDDFPDMMKDFALAQELEEVTPEEIADEPFLVESVDSEDPEISEEANKIFSAPDLGSDFDSLDDLDIPENITDDWIKELEGSDQISEDELDENSGEFKEADTIRFNPDVPKDTPDWLKELSETGQHISEEKEEIPDWLKDTGELTDTEKGETDDIPSWLNDLADIESIAEQEAKEQPSMVDQEDQDSDATQEGDEADWLKTLSALESVDEDLPTPPHSALENKKDDSDEDNALAWLESLGAEDENSAESPLEKELELDQTDSDDVEEIETINQDDAVEWLENLGANKGLDVGDSIAELPNQEPIPDIGAESGDPNEMDDWLNSLLDDVPANQINTEDDDEWMETIADLTPEADPQKPPGDTDWLKELDEAAVPKNSEDESDKETTNEEDSQDSTLEEELVVSQSENETNFEGEGDGVEEKLSD
ncbi:MAG: tetratricopeptide repeat protein, partial [Chloroflexi bacterium]|nr:tetratricopeptide repeat protein [Chloroflexota bacterium]